MTEPDAYTIGWVPFLGTTIFLDSKPLIPRPETEYWTEIAINEIKKFLEPKVLDLFAGSGCVGVSVLKHVSGARVDFGEKEVAHHKTIKRNIRDNGLSLTRAGILPCDVWDGISERYDFVLANPPYLSLERKDRIQDSVLKYEPHEALFSPESGYEHISRTLHGLRAHLKPGGVLYIEHEPEHADTLRNEADKLGFISEAHLDQYKMLRFTTVCMTQ